MTGALRLRWAAAVAALALCACSARDDRPSVLVVTIDTLRADAVGAWGVETGTTPALDDLAARGTRFADATTVTPLTLPAHASILTGLRPARHGLTVNGVARPALPVDTLAERLSDAGWSTGAFVSAAVLDGIHGLDAGFDVYDDALHVPGGPPRPRERRGDRTVDAALEWLDDAARRDRDAPWFAWVHLFDPHAPYDAPDGLPGEDRRAYLDEVRWADRQLGRLLAGLPDGPVIVVVTSDHGESLGEHGESTHGVLVFQGAMHVPLVVARAGAAGEEPEAFPRAGVVREDVVSVLDVTPTVLELVGLPPGDDLDGRSLARPSPDRTLPLECRSPAFYYGFSPLAGVRRGALKLVGAPEAEPAGWRLHHLATDPAEREGAPAADHPLRPFVPSPDPVDEADVVTDLDTLRALGYVGAATPTDDGAPRRDPREAMDLVDAIDRANSLLVAGRAAEAWSRLQALAGYDDVSELRFFRGRTLRALGRPAEAAAELGTAHVLQPGSAPILVEWGRALLEVAGGSTPPDPRAVAEAAGVFDLALERVPGDPEATAMRALAELLGGTLDAALARLDAALATRPSAVNLLLVKRRVLEALGRDADRARVDAELERLAPGLLGGG